ncbi:MAG: pectic acid lyase, partial [Planctomycetaceae bacterium]
ARKFEPPAVTGGESQGAMRTLMMLYRRTSDDKYLEPIPRAIAYYRSSLLPDGRLARFYELGSNRPLYFTKNYQLTYDDSDMPTHYGFKSSSHLDELEKDYDQLRRHSLANLESNEEPAMPRMSGKLRRHTAEVLSSLDERGAWVQDGRMRNFGEDNDTRRVIESATFAKNLRVLATYIAAMGAE